MKTPIILLLAAGCGFGAMAPAVAADHQIVLLAGKPSHGPGDHEFNAGCRLLKDCLASVPGLQVTVHRDGWPADASAFNGATAVVLYSDGGSGHPFIQADHLAVIGELAKRGVGIGLMHFAVEVPKDKGGPQFLDWVGGYYEDRYSCNPMWSPEFKTFPNHPVTRGVKPFSVRDEWYFNLRFRPDLAGITPLLVAKPSDAVRDGPYVWPAGPYPHVQANKGRDEIMMWAVERPDGGRGFGWTGGHAHKNWANENFRKVILNAMVWLAKLEVPAEGIASAPTPDQLASNLDPKQK